MMGGWPLVTIVVGSMMAYGLQCYFANSPWRDAHFNGVYTDDSIIRTSEIMNDIFPEGSIPKVVADGYVWAEGPVWVSPNMLLFSDVMTNTMHSYSHDSGDSPFLHPSGFLGSKDVEKQLVEPGTNGLIVDPTSGDLLMCEHGNRRIVRVKNFPQPNHNDGFAIEREPLVSHYKGLKFNSPNDMAVLTVGRTTFVYFTDPPYGLQDRTGAPSQQLENHPSRQLHFNGIYRFPIAIDGVQLSGKESQDALELLTTSHSRPNGIGFSLDGRQMVVANSDANNAYWRVFQLDMFGMLEGEGHILYNATAEGRVRPDLGFLGMPDGLKVHPKSGLVFATGPGGVLVLDLNKTGGEVVVGEIRTGKKTGNVCFGGDGNLYIAADNTLLAVAMSKANTVTDFPNSGHLISKS